MEEKHTIRLSVRRETQFFIIVNENKILLHIEHFSIFLFSHFGDKSVLGRGQDEKENCAPFSVQVNIIRGIDDRKSDDVVNVFDLILLRKKKLMNIYRSISTFLSCMSS